MNYMDMDALQFPESTTGYLSFPVTESKDLQNGSESLDCIKPFIIPASPVLTTIYGFISPILMAITTVTNCFVCAVLLRKNMRSPTNTLLVAIAASDLLTGTLPLPCFIHFYTVEANREWPNCSWALAYRLLTDILPTTFHTISIWLTVALAGQRYIYVCHAHRARELCTISNAVISIAIIHLLALISQLSRFADFAYIPIQAPSLKLYGPIQCLNVTTNHSNSYNSNSQLRLLMPSPSEGQQQPVMIDACAVNLRAFVQDYDHAYFNVYYWNRVIFTHFVPCTSLVVLNVLLVLAMGRAKKRRAQLLKQNRRSESRRLADSNCTTLMLVAVVGLFLLVEFPLAILIIVMIADNTFDLNLINQEGGTMAALIINFFIVLSYPLNFFIYCGMSRQFRQTFTELFCPTWLAAKIGAGGRTGAAGAGVEMTEMNGAGGARTLYESLAPCREANAHALVDECETAH